MSLRRLEQLPTLTKFCETDADHLKRMSRQTPLPKCLEYLRAFRRQTAKLAPEEINEDMDLSLLNGLLLKRIEGLTLDQGKRTLDEDHQALDGWLKTTAAPDAGMFFLNGYLGALPELVDLLLEARAKSTAKPKFVIQLPPDVKAKTKNGILWEIRWMGAKVFAYPEDQSGFEYHVKQFREGPRHKQTTVTNEVGDYTITVNDVEYGSVVGIRRITDMPVVEVVHIEYALRVPGGYVFVSVLKSGNRTSAAKFKEAGMKIEQCFHSIRIEHA